MREWTSAKKIVCKKVSLTSYSVSGLAEMVAVGLGLPVKTFSDAGRYG